MSGKMTRTNKTGQMTSEAAKEIANKILRFLRGADLTGFFCRPWTSGCADCCHWATRTPWLCVCCWSRCHDQTILWTDSKDLPHVFVHGSRRPGAADTKNQGLAGGVDHKKSDSSANSQMQSQGLELPPKPEVGHLVALVSTKERNDLDTGDLEKCGLYIEENPSCLVALGRLYEGFTTVHNIPLRHDEVKGAVGPTELADGPDHDVMWDAIVFGLFNDDFPLYIKHEDLSEIVHCGQCLSISYVIEEYRCLWISRATIHTEIWAINWMHNSKRDMYLRAYLNDVVIWFCLLHNWLDNYLKGIINSALKGLDNTPQSKSKAATKWIVVKCNGQKGSTECGPLEVERLKAFCIQWATYYLKVKHETISV
ncbi:hypothetical protein HKD37_03G007689 [Glycine soja]